MQKTQLSVLVAAALVAMASAAQAAQGPSSSQDAYVQGVAPGVQFTSVLTTGDSVGGYRMAGIPDGLGAYDNGNGTFTVLMNHELGTTVGVARDHGAKGGFVSEWVINKNTLQVVSGGDLIKNVYYDTGAQVTGASNLSFNRLCSADLAKPSAFFNASSGMGSTARIFMNGEESGNRGWALANVASGADKGNSYVLTKFQRADGTGGWENLVANATTGNLTVVAGTNDGGTGTMQNRVNVYVGNKTNTGSEVDKAGLTNGSMGFINVTGVASEINNATTRTTGIANGAAFTVDANSGTAFSRPEDAAWSNDGQTLYFVTTDQLDKTNLAGQTQQGGTRLWAAHFNANFTGGTIEALVDSTTFAGGLNNSKPNMFDNITVNADGTITLQEDPGNNETNAKIWQYNPANGEMKMLAKFKPDLFGDVVNGVYTAGSHTKDEETSGVIDITDILNRNDGQKYSLLVVQDHQTAANLKTLGFMDAGADATAMVEGGQLLVMSAPVPEADTYAMMLAGLGLVGFMARRRKA